MTRLPTFDATAMPPTRDALHSYAKILGDLLKATRACRKHWWHASLRPSLRGLTTGVVNAGPGIELELDLTASQLRVLTGSDEFCLDLVGKSARTVADLLAEVLDGLGLDASAVTGDQNRSDTVCSDYSEEQAQRMHGALRWVSSALEKFRAGIREETSPIQVWPHHFDLSMIWLPGQKIPGEDPADAEQSDKQMNFGFVFGDDTFAEPYFYITAYPLPDALPNTHLPKGTEWKSDGFSGAVLYYKDLVEMQDPADYLQSLWSTLLGAGQTHLLIDE